MKEKLIYHLGYVLSFLLAIYLIIYLIFQYDNIPSSIATHYDFYGRIDMIGDKQSLINLCVIAGLIPCFFYCADTTPQFLNIPVIKKEKSPLVKSVLHQVMMWLSFLIECMLAIMFYASITKQNLPKNLMLSFLLFYIFIMIGMYVYFYHLRKK